MRELSRLARHALGRAGRGLGDGDVVVHDADRFEIVCDRPLPLEVDGEDLGDVEHVLVEAEREAVTVLVPET